MDESNPTTPLPSHPFGPQFDPTIHDSGQVPPNVHGINPKAPQAERDVVRPGGRETTPSDGPPHKLHALPRLGGNQNVSQMVLEKHPDFEAVGNKITWTPAFGHIENITWKSIPK